MQVKFLKNFFEFMDTLQPITAEEADEVSIMPDFYSGKFFKDRIEELREFCKKNPKFHIASHFLGSELVFNKGMDNAFFYYLCEGDKDPDIIYLCHVHPESTISPLGELLRHQCFSQSDKVD